MSLIKLLKIAYIFRKVILGSNSKGFIIITTLKRWEGLKNERDQNPKGPITIAASAIYG